MEVCAHFSDSKGQMPYYLQQHRPISILCTISKALERIASEQITGYLEAFDLLDPQQTAYRKGFSTQTTLIRVMDDMRLTADPAKESNRCCILRFYQGL